MKAWWGRYWKMVLAMVAIFLAGAVVGGVLTAGAIVQTVKQRLNPDNWTRNVMEGLTAELDLSAEQQGEIEPVVRESVLRSRGIMQRAGIAWARNLAATKEEMAPHLDDEQRAELEALIEKRRSKIRQFLLRRQTGAAGDLDEVEPPESEGTEGSP
ncbi:MAG: hypothetical protein AAGK14_08915 [Verrucomicrobiota bacterium]